MIVGLEKSNIIKFFTDVVMYRPWWDTLEDNLIYILVMVGLIVVPSAIIMGTPLDCNFCQVDGGGGGGWLVGGCEFEKTKKRARGKLCQIVLGPKFKIFKMLLFNLAQRLRKC